MMVVLFGGKPADSNRVTMQPQCRCNVMYQHRMSWVIIPYVVTVHKRVKVQMEDQSVKPPYKFTDLCWEVMRIMTQVIHQPLPRGNENQDPSPDGREGYVFDAIIPILLGVHQGGAIASYQTDCAYSAAIVAKIKKSAASWFFGYWLHVCKYRLVTVQMLMESFSIEAACLVSYSTFDPISLTVDTAYADNDQLLEGVEADLRIDQGWESKKEEIGGVAVNVVGHRKALAMS
jgi:hypothetical protein